jgi:hypothetical protein
LLDTGPGTVDRPATTRPDLRAILSSPSFLVGAALLVIWGVTALAFAGGDCELGCDAVTLLGQLWYVAIGVLPGAFIVAGLLAPLRPFTTGFLLGSIHVALLWLHWLADWPEVQNGFIMSASSRPDPVEVLVLVSVVAVIVATLVTGVIGRVSSAIVNSRRMKRSPVGDIEAP